MKIDFHVFELVTPFLGITLGIALLHRIIRSLKIGSVEWYHGEQFKISMSESPIAFLVMIIMYSAIFAFFIFGSILWLLHRFRIQ